MLLGNVPAETVQSILEPLLTNFHELMLQLPPYLQTDFENILRIYPDVAERFGVRIKPSILESLRCFVEYRSSGVVPVNLRPIWNLIVRQNLSKSWKAQNAHSCNEGQGFFTTDKGSPFTSSSFTPKVTIGLLLNTNLPNSKSRFISATFTLLLLAPGLRSGRFRLTTFRRMLMQCASGRDHQDNRIEP